MASDFAINAGRKLFEKHLHQYQPADPLYETYTDKRGRERRRKRELPPGLTHRDEKILKSVKRRAHYLDKGFNICGMRFGWTFIIGIIPGAGDVANATLNYFLVVRKARQAEIPDWLLRRMLANNAISAIVGCIPVAGDIIIAVFKTNSRNAALLEELLRIRGEEALVQMAVQEGEHQSAPGGSGSAVGEQGEHPPSKRESNGWFGRRGKGRGQTANPMPRPRVSGDSRFVENVS